MKRTKAYEDGSVVYRVYEWSTSFGHTESLWIPSDRTKYPIHNRNRVSAQVTRKGAAVLLKWAR